MKVVLVHPCLASLASAAPSVFHYLPHFGSCRQLMPPPQVECPERKSHTNKPALMFSNPPPPPPFFSCTHSPHGFIKYCLPQPPGRQSVEVEYTLIFNPAAPADVPSVVDAPAEIAAVDAAAVDAPPTSRKAAEGTVGEVAAEAAAPPAA
uniref:Uncharacterized protein n=1 Tax=Hippocampus comes TaxID=109280 RepID=A0A3Q2Z7M9_HIPCM